MLTRFNVPRPQFQADFHGHHVDGIATTSMGSIGASG